MFDRLAEALAECDRCQGRQYGDCSDQCRYYGPSARVYIRTPDTPFRAGHPSHLPAPWAGPLEPTGWIASE